MSLFSNIKVSKYRRIIDLLRKEVGGNWRYVYYSWHGNVKNKEISVYKVSILGGDYEDEVVGSQWAAYYTNPPYGCIGCFWSLEDLCRQIRLAK